MRLSDFSRKRRMPCVWNACAGRAPRPKRPGHKGASRLPLPHDFFLFFLFLDGGEDVDQAGNAAAGQRATCIH